jgi:transcriptional regulator with XRE-family HTH domain
MARFGEQLRKLRESKDLSIKDYADLIPLSISYLSEIERGLKPSPGMKMVERIAEVLDVKPDYFDEYKAEKAREAVLQDPRLDLLFRLIIRLSRKEREEVLTFVRGLAERAREDTVDIFDGRVDRLLENIDRSIRTGALEELYYVDFRDTLQRALSPGNHLIRGRQGAGKTVLLRKAHLESLQRGNVSFYIDAEVHRNLSFPESLIRIMEEIFSELGDIIRENLERSEGGLVGQLIGSSRRKKDLENLRKIGDAVDSKIIFLEDLLRQYVHLDLSGERKEAEKKEALLLESKKERLEKEALNLGLILESICKLGGQRATFIHLDDLNSLPPEDQPEILDFLRRISKGKSIFLTVSLGPEYTIKSPGDFEILSIDIPLEDFRDICRFMEALLTLHRNEEGPGIGAIQSLFKDEKVFNALVLSSGGVVRDFLKIFRRTVRIARLRQGRTKMGSGRAEVEDVRSGALEFLLEDKYAALRDLRDPSPLRSTLLQVKGLCREKGTCLFRVREKGPEGLAALEELAGLRLLHPVSHTGGKERSRTYMLDVGLCLEEGIPVALEDDNPFKEIDGAPFFEKC